MSSGIILIGGLKETPKRGWIWLEGRLDKFKICSRPLSNYTWHKRNIANEQRNRLLKNSRCRRKQEKREIDKEQVEQTRNNNKIIDLSTHISITTVHEWSKPGISAGPQTVSFLCSACNKIFATSIQLCCCNRKSVTDILQMSGRACGPAKSISKTKQQVLAKEP